MNLLGTFAGIVEANNDSEKLGRIKVRVPHVYGATSGTGGYVGTNDLPWALPVGMPAGGSPNSGGLSHLPEPGDKVWVRFLDGEPEKPIWEWGMQSQADRDGLTLHSYDETKGKVQSPNRAFWTRYGHGIEINIGSIIESTSSGYRMVLTDASQAGASDGNVSLATPNGNLFELDDLDDSATLNVNQDYSLLIGSGLIGRSDSFSWNTSSQDFSVDSGRKITGTASDNIELSTAKDFNLDTVGDANISASDGDVNLTASNNMSFNFTSLYLGFGANEPFVLGNQLSSFLQTLLIFLDTHTHSNGNNGNPTGPPVVLTEATVQPTVSELLSSTIFGIA